MPIHDCPICFGALGLLLLLGGCAGMDAIAAGNRDSYRRSCYMAGWQPGPGLEHCADQAGMTSGRVIPSP
jgi:hypothetical protein